MVPFNIFDLEYNSTADKFIDKKLLLSLTKNNIYDRLKEYIASPAIPIVMENYMDKEILHKLDKNRYIVIVLAPMLQGLLNEKALNYMVRNDTIYKTIPIFPLVSSKVMNSLYIFIIEHFKFVSITQEGSWKVIVLQKKVVLHR